MSQRVTDPADRFWDPTPTCKKPFCWLAEGSLSNVWRALRDDFLNYFRSEECREMGERVG